MVAHGRKLTKIFWLKCYAGIYSCCPHTHGITAVSITISTVLPLTLSPSRGITVTFVPITAVLLRLPRFYRCPHPHAALYAAVLLLQCYLCNAGEGQWCTAHSNASQSVVTSGIAARLWSWPRLIRCSWPHPRWHCQVRLPFLFCWSGAAFPPSIVTYQNNFPYASWMSEINSSAKMWVKK